MPENLLSQFGNAHGVPCGRGVSYACFSSCQLGGQRLSCAEFRCDQGLDDAEIQSFCCSNAVTVHFKSSEDEFPTSQIYYVVFATRSGFNSVV
jgi:hypothetical protein